MHPDPGWGLKLGKICSDLELNQQHFEAQYSAQPTEPHQPQPEISFKWLTYIVGLSSNNYYAAEL